MKKDYELNEIVYDIMALQIRFGTYRYSDHLPTIEEASKLLLVSIDTVRSAYLLLKNNGYITLTKKGGAEVKRNYSDEDIEQHIQLFFSQRYEIMSDVSHALKPLLCNAHWTALKNLSPDMLDKVEQLAVRSDVPPLHSMLHHLQYNYGALKNDLLMRLVLQIFLFFHAPFLSIPENMNYFTGKPSPLIDMISLCRHKNWSALYKAIDEYYEYLCFALDDFCRRRIKYSAPSPKDNFVWNAYEKPSQVCYTLGMKILASISSGTYPAGSFLPSLTQMAEQYQVSVSTVRRTISLLNSIGTVNSMARVGTQVLPLHESLECCNFSDPIVRRRLIAFEQSFQLLAFSCRLSLQTAELSLITETVQKIWKAEVERIKQLQRYDMIVYRSLELVARYSCSHTVRTVYSEAMRQLFWGYPLLNIHGRLDAAKAFYLPYIKDFQNCMDTGDIQRFAVRLEELLYLEVQLTTAFLLEKKICSASDIFISDLESDRIK